MIYWVDITYNFVVVFWVSSLAYPNLLGTKGYVVVVVLMHGDTYRG